MNLWFSLEPRSATKFEADLKRELKIFQTESRFTRKLCKWPKKEYCVEDQQVLFVITNFPNIAHLNLDNFGAKGLLKMPEIALMEKAKRYPQLLELPRLSRGTCMNVASNMKGLHKVTLSTMTVEYRYRELLSLIHQWDLRRFERMYSHHCRLNSYFDHYIMTSFTELVILRCTDSDFILRYFRDIHAHFYRVSTYRGRLQLPSSFSKFFLRHLKKTNNLENVLKEEWFFREDFLLIGLVLQDLELVKLALELGCPSILLPHNSFRFTIVMSQSYWRPKKDGIDPISFYSCEYCIVFTRSLLQTMLFIYDRYGEIKDPECLSLIWRAIPTPYLPLEEMEFCFDRCKAPIAPATRKENVWSYIKDSFEGDIPDVYKPRTLKHLCRCAIRQTCRLTEQIEKLPLPEVLQKYVKLDF